MRIRSSFSLGLAPPIVLSTIFPPSFAYRRRDKNEIFIIRKFLAKDGVDTLVASATQPLHLALSERRTQPPSIRCPPKSGPGMDEACWIIIAGGEVSAMTDQTRDGKKAPAEH